MIGASVQRPELAADVRAAAVGQHEVEDDRLGRVQAGGGERLLRGRRRLHLVAGAAQVRLERAEDLRLVVDDEDALTAHAGTSTGSSTTGRASANDAPCPGARLRPEPPAVRLARSRARSRARGPRLAVALAGDAVEGLEDPLQLAPPGSPARWSTTRIDQPPSASRVTRTCTGSSGGENLSAFSTQVRRARAGPAAASTCTGGSLARARLTSTRVGPAELRRAPGRRARPPSRARGAGSAAPAWSRERSRRFSTSRSSRACSTRIVSSSSARSASVERELAALRGRRAPARSPSSGERRSWETAWSTAVLIVSLRRSASASNASRASRSRSRGDREQRGQRGQEPALDRRAGLLALRRVERPDPAACRPRADAGRLAVRRSLRRSPSSISDRETPSTSAARSAIRSSSSSRRVPREQLGWRCPPAAPPRARAARPRPPRRRARAASWLTTTAVADVHGEREPVLAVRERERVQRRQEEPVEREHARDRDRQREARAPDSTATGSTAKM